MSQKKGFESGMIHIFRIVFVLVGVLSLLLNLVSVIYYGPESYGGLILFGSISIISFILYYYLGKIDTYEEVKEYEGYPTWQWILVIVIGIVLCLFIIFITS